MYVVRFYIDLASSVPDRTLSLLDFCPYTHCWDVHEQILRTLQEVGVVTFRHGQSIFSLTPELAVCADALFSLGHKPNNPFEFCF